jgi:hypothetical protein
MLGNVFGSFRSVLELWTVTTCWSDPNFGPKVAFDTESLYISPQHEQSIDYHLNPVNKPGKLLCADD